MTDKLSKLPKVLIITTTFTRWERDELPSFVYSFAQSIKERCEVHVLAPHTKGAKKYEEMNGLKVHRFVYAPANFEKFGAGISIVSALKKDPKTLLLIPVFIFSAALKIVKLHYRNGYNVVHVNWLVPFGPVVGFLRIFTDFRYVITSHGSDVFPFTSRKGVIASFVSWLHKIFTLPKVDMVIPVSNPLNEAINQYLPGIPQEKISVISMGLNYHSFSNLVVSNKEIRNPLQIVFAGRLAEIKGVRYLISAMDILRKKNIDFELQIYGDGLLRNDLEVQVRELGLSRYIKFNGFVDHDTLPMRLAEGDIFVGPSITTSLGESEGLGLVFLEAMAAGLVVIGSNVGGISDVVVNQKTGILVDEKKPEAIVAAIELLISDNILRKKLIDGGRELAKDYDWTSIASKYLQIYGFEK